MTIRRESLDQATLWITVSRSSEGGRRCRDYAVRDDTGAVLLTARAFVWDRELKVTDPGSGSTILLLRRRLAFPLTGRVDVLIPPAVPLGAVYRSGRFADKDGQVTGRFRDARGSRRRVTESVLAGIANALVGADGSDVSSPTGYVCIVASEPAGTLALARAPWPEQAGSEPPALVALLRRLVPARARQRGARGWKFEREAPLLAGDPRFVIGAALFQVELSQW